MNDLQTPATITAKIAASLQQGSDSAERMVLAWRAWAGALDQLIGVMPGLPAAVTIPNDSGGEDTVEPGHAGDYRAAMTQALREARNHADAYAATAARTFTQIEVAAASSLSSLGQWVGHRYFPAVVEGRHKSLGYCVIDQAEDRTGFWRYEWEPGDPAWFETLNQATDQARQLNENPLPYPQDAPRGRYIIWAGDYSGFRIIDRGEDLDEWRVLTTRQSRIDALQQVEEYRTGKATTTADDETVVSC